MRILLCIFVVTVVVVSARKYRKLNEITILNHAEANLRIRCQSIKTDLNDQFLGPMSSFTFHFHDIDRGDRHFWCDAYGLFGLFESFDVFGRSASSRRNQTWLIKNDGLYNEMDVDRAAIWEWTYPPMNSYSIDDLVLDPIQGPTRFQLT